MRNAGLVCAYILAALVANLLVWRYGQAALLFTAIVFLPIDFLARDVLHHRWEKDGNAAWPMAGLVLGSALLTLLLTPAAYSIAIASAAAFALAGLSNAFIYGITHAQPRRIRMNSSNIIAAIVDSTAFPLIAFGGLDWRLSASQSLLKITGGVVLTFIYLHLSRSKSAHE